MTTPAASVLGRIARVMEGARLIVRQSSPLYPPQQPPALVTVTEWAVSKLDEQVAALPRPDDPEAVEALAKWMFEEASAAGDWRSNDDDMTPSTWEGVEVGNRHPWLCVARAILAALSGAAQ